MAVHKFILDDYNMQYVTCSEISFSAVFVEGKEHRTHGWVAKWSFLVSNDTAVTDSLKD